MQMQKGVHAHQNWERKQDSFTWAQHCQTHNVSVSTRARKCTETKKAKQSNKKEHTNQTKVTYTPRSESLEVSIGQVFELRGSLDIPLPKVKKGKKKEKNKISNQSSEDKHTLVQQHWSTKRSPAYQTAPPSHFPFPYHFEGLSSFCFYSP